MASRFFVVSDTHLNHHKLTDMGVRPVEFEDRIARRWRQLVHSEDVVIHLGDVCVGGDADAHARISVLPGRKWLVLGNHDRKSVGWYLGHGWDSVCHGLRLELFGQCILLTHTPVRHDGWYTMNVHGHLHNDAHRVAEFVDVLDHRHCLVALEGTEYAPVLLSSLVERFSRRRRPEG